MPQVWSNVRLYRPCASNPNLANSIKGSERDVRWKTWSTTKLFVVINSKLRAKNREFVVCMACNEFSCVCETRVGEGPSMLQTRSTSLWDQMGYSNSPKIKMGNSVNDRPRDASFGAMDGSSSNPVAKVDVEEKLVTSVFEPQQGYIFDKKLVRLSFSTLKHVWFPRCSAHFFDVKRAAVQYIMVRALGPSLCTGYGFASCIHAVSLFAIVFFCCR